MSNVAWIKVIDETEATGDLAEAYEAIVGSSGRAPNILRIHSLNPRSMVNHSALYRTLAFGPSPLKRYQREMIGTLVSVLNNCHY